MSYEKRKWEASVWNEVKEAKPKRPRSKTHQCDSCGYYRHIEAGKVCARCLEFDKKHQSKSRVDIPIVKHSIPKPREFEEIITQTSYDSDLASGIVSFVTFLCFIWWAFTIYAVILWLVVTFLIIGVLWIKRLILKRS